MSALIEGVAAVSAAVRMDPVHPVDDTLVQCLFDDVASGVSVYDARDLSLIAANAAARSWVGPRPAADEDSGDVAGRLTGATLLACLPAEVREDHHAAVTDAVQTGRAVRLIGMVRGRWCATVYRATKLTDGRQAVVSVVSPIGEGTSFGHDGIDTRRAGGDDLGPLAGLTERELEVLRLIGTGMTSDQIAQHLHRSAKTVQGHRNALGMKLGVENRVELARIAIHAGLTAIEAHDAEELGRRSRRANRRAAMNGTTSH